MKLLVSAVTVEEARACVAGGAHIIDVKNPREGSLGGQCPVIIREIAGVIPRGRELSAAIGDVSNKPGLVAQAGVGAAVCGARYVKLGLCADFTVKEAVGLVKTLVLNVKGFRKNTFVVVCGYADARCHGLILPERIPDIVFKSGADMAMIDTLKKGDGKGLFDYMSEREIHQFSVQSKSLGLQVALAGSLTKEDVLRIKADNYCDIIGVRSLACKGGKRSSVIEAARVKQIRQWIEG